MGPHILIPPNFIFFTYLPTFKISCVWREWLKSLKFGGPVLGISFSASKILVLKLGLHKSICKHPHYVQISALHVKWFWNYKRIDNFSSQILPIFLFFLCLNLRSHDLRIPKIGTHYAFNNTYVESKFQLCRFYRLLVTVSSKSIIVCQNSRTKPLGKSPHSFSYLKRCFVSNFVTKTRFSFQNFNFVSRNKIFTKFFVSM